MRAVGIGGVNVVRELAILELGYAGGDVACLLTALQFCIKHELPLPAWAAPQIEDFLLKSVFP